MHVCCRPTAPWQTSGTPANTSNPERPASSAGAATDTGCSAPSTLTKRSRSEGWPCSPTGPTTIFSRSLEQTGCAHLLRVWNYLPQINGDGGGLERYRQFNLGRQQAFVEAGQAAFEGAPAACALGIHQGALCIRFLAGRTAPLPIENPRQVSAYRYPPTYGPRAPTFSRAAIAEIGGGEVALFISGTASIVGHETVHVGEVLAQTQETLRNLDAVIAAANERTTARFESCGARLRGVRPPCRGRCPSVPTGARRGTRRGRAHGQPRGLPRSRHLPPGSPGGNRSPCRCQRQLARLKMRILR